jgi:hypothetical protein
MYDWIVSRFSLTEQWFHGIPQLVDCTVLRMELLFFQAWTDGRAWADANKRMSMRA